MGRLHKSGYEKARHQLQAHIPLVQFPTFILFRPERWLNSASAFVFEVGDHPRPVKNAALRPCQALLCFPKFPLGIAHSPGLVELWVNGH
jgi:hypothetical protein